VTRPSVLVFAGSDPSGGAGIQADIQAISAMEAHPLPVITALTVQDNDRVYQVQPVAADLVRQQARTLMNKIDIAAVKQPCQCGSDCRHAAPTQNEQAQSSGGA
jgi:hydroxymethylpyrimidine/phosphomethylpyrimidine kinase